jgi:hypothetical protein
MLENLTEDFQNANFGDKRLTKRLVKIVDSLSEHPNVSIPAAVDGRAEMEGAYRFFNNDSVTPQAIEAPHIDATLQRIRQTKVVLLVQDTTQIDLTRPEVQVEGSGPLDSQMRFGAFYHPLVAFDDQGLPLGIPWSKCWVRDQLSENRTATQKREQIRNTPIEQKESMRWLEGFRASKEVAESCPQTQCICVSDREGDIYELLAEPRQTADGNQVHWLVRASHDRYLVDQTAEVDGMGEKKLLSTVHDTKLIYETTIEVSRRVLGRNDVQKLRQQSRDKRLATVQVRAITVRLRPPERPDRQLPDVTVNVILVEETHPPEGEVAIQWLLVTTMPIETREQIELILHYYTLRWQIEVYFKTLKQGCRVEERYFERIGPLVNCFKVYTIVAWKILYLCRLSRECPDVSCEVVFSPSEWKPVYQILRKKTPPKQPPTLNEMVKMIASLGGYVVRKSNQPGTQTLWIGLQRLNDLSNAWVAFGPETRSQ